MTTLQHKDYIATIEADPEAGIFHGEVINTRDVLTFQGRSLDELTQAFADTIAVAKVVPRARQGAGAALFRQFDAANAAGLHRRVAEAAARLGKSLNGFIRDALEHATG